MATLTVNVKAAGSNRQYMLVKVYDRNNTLAGQATTDSSGNVAIVLPNSAYYQIFVEDMHTAEYVPQWVGQNGAGVWLQDQAGTFDVSSNLTVNMDLSSDQQLFGTRNDVLAIRYNFWKDTTTGQVVRLLPGDERRAMGTNSLDPLYRHVLAGPALTYEDAAAL